MGLSCLFGHSWSGCKCTKCHKTQNAGHQWEKCKCEVCGRTRDEDHDWVNNCEKCTICGKTRKDAHQWDGFRCKSCSQIFIYVFLKDLSNDESDSNKRDVQKALKEIAADPILSVSAMHKAAYDGNLNALKLLIQAGIDVNITNPGWNEGKPPLAQAVLGGKAEAVTFLANSGADLEMKRDNGCTPLHDAAQAGRLEVVEALLKAGANVNSKDSNGGTPLFRAALFGYDQIVLTLLNAGADVFVQAVKGHTAFSFAAQGHHTHIVRILEDWAKK